MSPKATKINYVVRYMLYILIWLIANIDTKGHHRLSKGTRGQKRKERLQKVIKD